MKVRTNGNRKKVVRYAYDKEVAEDDHRSVTTHTSVTSLCSVDINFEDDDDFEFQGDSSLTRLSLSQRRTHQPQHSTANFNITKRKSVPYTNKMQPVVECDQDDLEDDFDDDNWIPLHENSDDDYEDVMVDSVEPHRHAHYEEQDKRPSSISTATSVLERAVASSSSTATSRKPHTSAIDNDDEMEQSITASPSSFIQSGVADFIKDQISKRISLEEEIGFDANIVHVHEKKKEPASNVFDTFVDGGFVENFQRSQSIEHVENGILIKVPSSLRKWRSIGCSMMIAAIALVILSGDSPTSINYDYSDNSGPTLQNDHAAAVSTVTYDDDRYLKKSNGSSNSSNKPTNRNSAPVLRNRIFTSEMIDYVVKSSHPDRLTEQLEARPLFVDVSLKITQASSCFTNSRLDKDNCVTFETPVMKLDTAIATLPSERHSCSSPIRTSSSVMSSVRLIITRSLHRLIRSFQRIVNGIKAVTDIFTQIWKEKLVDRISVERQGECNHQQPSPVESVCDIDRDATKSEKLLSKLRNREDVTTRQSKKALNLSLTETLSSIRRSKERRKQQRQQWKHASSQINPRLSRKRRHPST